MFSKSTKTWWSGGEVSDIGFTVSRGGEFGDQGGEEVLSGGAGGSELRFQRVHQGHQLLHFGHDPALLGEGGTPTGILARIP